MAKEKGRRKKTKIFLFILRIVLICTGFFAMELACFLLLFLLTSKMFAVDTVSCFATQNALKSQYQLLDLAEYYGSAEVNPVWYQKMYAELVYFKKQDTRSFISIQNRTLLGNKKLFSFQGVNKIMETSYRNAFVSYFADERKQYQMTQRSMPGGFGGSFLLNLRSRKSWEKQAPFSYPHKQNGYFEKGMLNDCYYVIIEVEGNGKHGFLKLEYELNSLHLNRFLYLEAGEIYNESRAMATIASATAVYQPVKLKKESLTFEIEELPDKLTLDMILSGEPNDLIKANWDRSLVKLNEIGVYETSVTFNDTMHYIDVTVQDTIAPKVIKTEYRFFVGEEVSADWLSEYAFSDLSMPIVVRFQDGADSYQITNEDAKDDSMLLSVSATDACGNTIDTEISILLYKNSDLPVWYQYFYDQENEVNKEHVRNNELLRLKKDLLYECSEAEIESAIEGYRKSIRHELDVKIVGDEWYGHELVAFYDSLNSIPEYIIEGYAENDWTFCLTDAELWLDDFSCAGITYYSDYQIDITSLYNNYEDLRATTIHEIGHFYDWMIGFEGRYDAELPSNMESVKSEIDYGDEDLQTWREENKYDYAYEDFVEGGYRIYSLTNPEEFFADSFYFYCMYPDKMRSVYPEIYGNLDQMIQEK